ncbi:MAG: RNA polymerase sigma factor [bacterium]|nr:RNA polymerase sigma factor [bacterium]
MNEEITTEAFFIKLKKRNKNAFKLLYENFKIPLYHLIYSIIKDKEKTADIIQETFIRVIKSINQLEDVRKIKYWIFRIAVNLTINVIKKDKRFSYAGDNLELIADKMTSDNFKAWKNEDPGEQFHFIHQQVALLPLKQRVVFTLKYVENLKETEISEILNIPVGTVKSRLSVARNKIKSKLNNN